MSERPSDPRETPAPERRLAAAAAAAAADATDATPGAPEPPLEHSPRFRHQLVEVAIGAPAIGVLLALLLRFLSGVDSTEFLVASGVGIAVVFVALYLVRYRISAPRAVRIDDEGLTVIARSGAERTLLWKSVVAARHRARNGLRWEWTTDRGKKPSEFLRDDGFSVKQWSEISERIERELRRRGVEVETDSFGRVFREG